MTYLSDEVVALLERIEKKLDALLTEKQEKENAVYNQKEFVSAAHLTRYKLRKLFDDGFLTAFNPYSKKKGLTDQDLKAVEDAQVRYQWSKRA